jgi:hypothetical protein
MALNSSGPISLIGSITGQSIALEAGLSSSGPVSLFDTNLRLLTQVSSGPISMFNAYGKSLSIKNVTWPSNLSGGNFNTLGSSQTIINGSYLVNGGTVTTTWTMKAFPQTARATSIVMYFGGLPITRNADNSISYGTSYYWGAYNTSPYNDNRTFCGSQSNYPQNTDSQVAGMTYYCLTGNAGGGRTVFTDGPSGFSVTATISGNDITCTITNNTGQDQFIYGYSHNGGLTRQIWYWGWYYSGEYQFSLFDYSMNRGTWNNQSGNTYGVPLYSVVQVILNGTPYNISKAHQSGATQANIISDIKSALESALSDTGVTINNYTNGIQIISTTTPTISYTYYFPDGSAFNNGTTPSYYGSSNFTPTIS